MNRYLGALFLGVCLSSTALVGCGDDSSEDDGEDGGSKAEINEAAAASTASLSASAVTQLNAGDGSSAAGSLFAVAGSALSIALPSGSQAQSVVGDLGVAGSADCEAACTGEGDSGSCDFTGCDYGSYSLQGHMEWGAGHFACDLTYGIAATSEGQSFEFDYHLVSDIDYTATSIDGTLSMDGSSSAGGQTSNFDVDVTYNHLEFPEAGGCPTGGSISVSASIDAGGQSYDASGDVTFPVSGCVG